MESDNQLYSIQVRELVLSLSDFKNQITILNYLTLNVKLGNIYSLLGPSGCGKTTLIRCILGLIKPNSGTIRLFHRQIDSKNRHMLEIPGKDVGYMPQDYSLYNDMTLLETLDYHRALHNVNNIFNKFSVYKLIDIMELGDHANKLVKLLSGGQLRRLSFACALIHKPRLLILDEPTVGLDPLLRQRIWKILNNYVNDNNASVLITTHYIEESRNAHQIGFMRRGHILAENSPNKLISMFKVKSLEDVFFELCIKQKKQSKLWKRTFTKSDANKFIKKANQIDKQQINSEMNDLFALNEMIKKEELIKINEFKQYKEKFKLKKSDNEKKINLIWQRQKLPLFLDNIYNWLHRLSVVIKRISIQTKRRKSALFAQYLLPLITILLFYFCVGETPKNIQLAIVNDDQTPDLNLSSLFLSKLNTDIIKPVNFKNLNSAIESVRRGESWAVMRIPKNFSTAFVERTRAQLENEDITNEALNQSTIIINANLANRILYITIQHSLDLSLQAFLNQSLIQLNYNANLFSMPMRLEEIIYGSFYSLDTDNYYALKDYNLLGIVIILNYTISFGLTVLILADENKIQIIERNIVIGISPTVIIIAHLVVSFFKNLLNIILLLYLTTQLFYAPIQFESIKWAFLLLILQSLTGLSNGMAISALCTDFFMCAVLSNGILLVMFIMSGVLWSLEALPNYLRLISLVQPITYPVESLRCLINRGHSIIERRVYYGFLISIIYFLIFFILSVILFKRKH